MKAKYHQPHKLNLKDQPILALTFPSQHTIYVNVLCNFRKQTPKYIITSSHDGQYQFVLLLHTTHNLLFLKCPIHYME